MEFLLYLIFFGIVSVVLALANYYFKLLFLSGRESFERLELVDWIRIVPDELIKLLEFNGSLQYGAIAFFVSAFVSYLWTLLGGIIGAPHYSDAFGNYFFLSFLLPITFFDDLWRSCGIDSQGPSLYEPKSFFGSFLRTGNSHSQWIGDLSHFFQSRRIWTFS